jgi:hypothetical protein
MQATSPLDVTVGPASGAHLLVAKMQSAQVELNVWLTRADVECILAGVPATPGSKSLAAGDSAGSKVFWSRTVEGLTFVAVGQDDETWDVGVTLTASESRELLAELTAGLNEVRSNTSLERSRER